MRSKIILVLFLCLGFVGAKSQECAMPVNIFIPEQVDNLPDAARSYLENKLMQLVTANSMSADAGFTPFVLTAKIDILHKDILPGPPTQHSYTLSVNLYMGDYNDHKFFSTANIEVKAVGTNETKAYIDGIKRMNVNSPAVKTLVADSRIKILNYYDNNYQNLLKKAQAMASMKNYEGALAISISIPECCKGYDQALSVAVQIYQQYVDQACRELLGQAKMAWVAMQNADGAAQAGQYLSLIYPDAACYGDAMTLYNEMKGKVLDDWKFTMKRYDDSVSIESQRINAIKEIGVAYGKGQQPVTTNLLWGR